jgi:hypothetical protein
VIIRYENTFAPITNIGPGLTYSLVDTGTHFVYSFTAGTDTIGW